MLPDMASSISSSVGFGFSRSKDGGAHNLARLAVAALRNFDFNPGFLQWMGGVGRNPSIVVIFLPSARETGATQERTASPSICTVHAPQRAIPQPNLVPVSCSESRSTQSSGVDGGSSTETGLPFTVNEIKGSSC